MNKVFFSANMYLSQILNKYEPRSLVPYSAALLKLRTVLKQWAASCFVEIFDSGSRARGTAISLGSDIDLLISLKSGCNENAGGLASCYSSLHSMLNSTYSSVRKQNVSVRVNLGELEIDITPARQQKEEGQDHSLYTSKNQSWVKTNIFKHIQDIGGSGRAYEIKALKIWRELYDLEFPSIYLEYLIVDTILSGKPKGPHALADNVWHILNELASYTNNPLFLNVVDPANSNNVLSDLLTKAEKERVIAQARIALQATDWIQIIW